MLAVWLFAGACNPAEEADRPPFAAEPEAADDGPTVPPVLHELHGGGPFVQTTWGPDIDLADVERLAGAARPAVAEQERALAARSRAASALADLVVSGADRASVEAAATTLVGLEAQVVRQQARALASLCAALGTEALARRAAHGPPAILLVAVTDHPLTTLGEPFSRLGEGVLTPAEKAVAGPLSAESRRLLAAARRKASTLSSLLGGLDLRAPPWPSAYAEAIEPTLSAWQSARKTALHAFAGFLATLHSARREELVRSGAFAHAIWPTADEVAERAAPPPPPGAVSPAARPATGGGPSPG